MNGDTFINLGSVKPKLVGPKELVIYLPGGKGAYSDYFLQRKAEGEEGWEPTYAHACFELFDKDARRFPREKWVLIAMGGSEVQSMVTPKGFVVSPGTYRVSLVYTTVDPATAKDVPCWMVSSPEFRLTAESRFE